MDSTRGYTRSPGAGLDPTPDRDRVYYHRGDVLVTGSWLTAYGRSYPIAELRNIRRMREPHSDLAINAGLVAVAMMIVIARLWDRLDTTGWVGALTILGFLVGLAVFGAWLRRRAYFMIAEYHGLTVVLVWEGDGERFGQIRRAIQRAIEAQPR